MAMSKFLNPKNDVAFKRIFGSNRNKDILIHFLNDMLEFRNESPIVNIELLKTTQEQAIAPCRASVLDILCMDEQGKQYIVEMQVADSCDFKKRIQYYASSVYVLQLRKGEKHEELQPVAVIAITNFALFPQKQDFKSDHLMLDRKTLENDLEDLCYVFLELPKFKKKIAELETNIDKWAYFFKHADEADNQELEQMAGDAPIIKRAYEEVCRFNWSEEELAAYAAMENCEATYESALKKSMEDGEAKGKAKEKLEIARKMLAKGETVAKICEITGLLEEAVLRLR